MFASRRFFATLALAISLAAQTQQRPPVRKPAQPAKPQSSKPAAEQKPAEPSLTERAQKALDTNDYPQAATLLREYLAKDAGDTAAWFNLGFAETALGNKPAAEEAYNKALALDAKLFPAHLNLAILLATQNRYADALPHLAAA